MTPAEETVDAVRAPPSLPGWRTPPRVAVIVLLLGSFALRIPQLDGPPLGPHDFRQTQTAITVQAWLDHGFTVLHYETPVFGPPWRAPFEFPAYQASAFVFARLGLSVDLACHLAAVLWFHASAILLLLLARRYAGEVAAVAALAVYTLSPFALLWGRAVLIDYASVALALGYLLATISWAERPRPRAAAAAALVGALAGLTKITTVAMVVPALAVVGVDALRRARRDGTGAVRAGAVLAAIAALPLAATGLWTWWADAVKRAAPATRWLTSHQLSGWNFGTLAQRLARENWGTIFDRMAFIAPGLLASLIVLTLVAVARGPGKLRAATGAAALGLLLPIAVFFNLYVVHDYYLIAITPCLALLVGIGIAEVLALRLPLRAAALALMAVAAVHLAWPAYDYARSAYESFSADPLVALGKLVARATPPDGWVVIEGDDWSSRIPYLARRRAFMIRPPFVPVELVAGRPEVTTLVCAECASALLARWPTRELSGREAGFSVYRLGPAVAAGGPRADGSPRAQ